MLAYLSHSHFLVHNNFHILSPCSLLQYNIRRYFGNTWPPFMLAWMGCSIFKLLIHSIKTFILLQSYGSRGLSLRLNRKCFEGPVEVLLEFDWEAKNCSSMMFSLASVHWWLYSLYAKRWHAGQGRQLNFLAVCRNIDPDQGSLVAAKTWNWHRKKTESITDLEKTSSALSSHQAISLESWYGSTIKKCHFEGWAAADRCCLCAR